MANAFHDGVRRYRVQQVKSLLHNVVSVNCRNSKGEPILLQALRIENSTKRRRMFNFLLQNGARVLDVDTNTGRDILTWACVLGRYDQVKDMLRSAPGSFDLHRKDLDGNTALHYAVTSHDEELVYLVAMEMSHYWVSVDIPDRNGLTPFLLAHKLGLLGIAEVLQTHGHASPRQRDPQTFRNGNEWFVHGKQERRKYHHKRIVSEIKRDGGLRFFKLPSLTQSHPLQTFLRRSDTEVGVWMSILPKKQSTPYPNESVSIQEDSPSASSEHDPSDPAEEHELLSPKSSARDIGTLLESYTEQLTPSYRVAAVPPPSETQDITAFTMVVAAMKEKAAKSKKKVAMSKLQEQVLKSRQIQRSQSRKDTASTASRASGDSEGKVKPSKGKAKKHAAILLPPTNLKTTKAN